MQKSFREKSKDLVIGEHRDDPIRYLEVPPVGCPRCQHGIIVVLSGTNGVMYTCANACGQRYWVDREP